jgi:hypothetical protein
MDDLDGCAAWLWLGCVCTGPVCFYIGGAETTRGSFLEGAWFGLRLTRGGAECVAGVGQWEWSVRLFGTSLTLTRRCPRTSEYFSTRETVDF